MIDQERIRVAEQILIDNGVEDPGIVLQAIGYVLMDTELYPDTVLPVINNVLSTRRETENDIHGRRN